MKTDFTEREILGYVPVIDNRYNVNNLEILIIQNSTTKHNTPQIVYICQTGNGRRGKRRVRGRGGNGWGRGENG